MIGALIKYVMWTSMRNQIRDSWTTIPSKATDNQCFHTIFLSLMYERFLPPPHACSTVQCYAARNVESGASHEAPSPLSPTRYQGKEYPSDAMFLTTTFQIKVLRSYSSQCQIQQFLEYPIESCSSNLFECLWTSQKRPGLKPPTLCFVVSK